MNVGFPGSSGRLFGFAREIVLGQTAINLPAQGIGPLASGEYDVSGTLGALTLRLAQPLSVSFTFDVKNLTTGLSAGAVTIAAGSVSGTNGGGPSTTSGDKLVLVLSVGGSVSVIVPDFEWYIS